MGVPDVSRLLICAEAERASMLAPARSQTGHELWRTPCPISREDEVPEMWVRSEGSGQVLRGHHGVRPSTIPCRWNEHALGRWANTERLALSPSTGLGPVQHGIPVGNIVNERSVGVEVCCTCTYLPAQHVSMYLVHQAAVSNLITTAQTSVRTRQSLITCLVLASH